MSIDRNGDSFPDSPDFELLDPRDFSGLLSDTNALYDGGWEDVAPPQSTDLVPDEPDYTGAGSPDGPIVNDTARVADQALPDVDKRPAERSSSGAVAAAAGWSAAKEAVDTGDDPPSAGQVATIDGSHAVRTEQRHGAEVIVTDDIIEGFPPELHDAIDKVHGITDNPLVRPSIIKSLGAETDGTMIAVMGALLDKKDPPREPEPMTWQGETRPEEPVADTADGRGAIAQRIESDPGSFREFVATRGVSDLLVDASEIDVESELWDRMQEQGGFDTALNDPRANPQSVIEEIRSRGTPAAREKWWEETLANQAERPPWSHKNLRQLNEKPRFGRPKGGIKKIENHINRTAEAEVKLLNSNINIEGGDPPIDVPARQVERLWGFLQYGWEILQTGHGEGSEQEAWKFAIGVLKQITQAEIAQRAQDAYRKDNETIKHYRAGARQPELSAADLLSRARLARWEEEYVRRFGGEDDELKQHIGEGAATDASAVIVEEYEQILADQNRRYEKRLRHEFGDIVPQGAVVHPEHYDELFRLLRWRYEMARSGAVTAIGQGDIGLSAADGSLMDGLTTWQTERARRRELLRGIVVPNDPAKRAKLEQFLLRLQNIGQLDEEDSDRILRDERPVEFTPSEQADWALVLAAKIDVAMHPMTAVATNTEVNTERAVDLAVNTLNAYYFEAMSRRHQAVHKAHPGRLVRGHLPPLSDADHKSFAELASQMVGLLLQSQGPEEARRKIEEILKQVTGKVVGSQQYNPHMPAAFLSGQQTVIRREHDIPELKQMLDAALSALAAKQGESPIALDSNDPLIMQIRQLQGLIGALTAEEAQGGGQLTAMQERLSYIQASRARAQLSQAENSIGIFGGVEPDKIELAVGIAAALGSVKKIITVGSQTLHPFYINALTEAFGADGRLIIPPTVGSMPPDKELIIRLMFNPAPAGIKPRWVIEGFPPGGSFLLQAQHNSDFVQELLGRVADRNHRLGPESQIDVREIVNPKRLQPWPFQLRPHPDRNASILGLFHHEADGSPSRFLR